MRLLPEAADDRRCGTRRREFDPNLPPADAKANPDKINMASGGNGNITHLVGEMFKTIAGVNMIHLPYRGGGAALADLLGGQVPVLFTGVPTAIEYIRAGRLRALGVTSATRLEALPDVPTVGQFLPGYEAKDWKGIGAPKNTPPKIIDMLNEEINAALADPKFKARLVDLGGVPMSMTAAEFGKFVGAETEKWGNVIRAANIKL